MAPKDNYICKLELKIKVLVFNFNFNASASRFHVSLKLVFAEGGKSFFFFKLVRITIREEVITSFMTTMLHFTSSSVTVRLTRKRERQCGKVGGGRRGGREEKKERGCEGEKLLDLLFKNITFTQIQDVKKQSKFNSTKTLV